jgi:hypothetical protein
VPEAAQDGVESPCVHSYYPTSARALLARTSMAIKIITEEKYPADFLIKHLIVLIFFPFSLRL